jgi:hypothetical protein
VKRASLFLLGLGAVLVGCGSSDGAPQPGPGAGGAGGDSTGSGAGGEVAVPERYFLRVDDSPPADVVLDLDKEKAKSVFGAEAATIHLLDVDPTAMLLAALAIIQDACGTGWKADSQTPNYGCPGTALGQTFGPSWTTSPEFALVRVLSMTPANADMSGTSLDDLQQLFVQNPQLFAVDFPSMLSEAMGIGRTTPFIPLAKLADVARAELVATHPAASAGGFIPVSLDDSLHDMAPLATKLGPVGQAPYDQPGEHPGLLVPDDGSFVTSSDALTAAFHMRIVASSNLRWVDGVDLSAGLEGRGEAFVLEGSAPLSFDFLDPVKTIIEGIAASPTLNLRIAIDELPIVVPSCTNPAVCKGNTPATPVGVGTVWTQPPYFLEHLVGSSALATYGTRVFAKCYLVLNGNCLMGVDIGKAPDPAGWTIFTSNVNGVTVPGTQYLWELLGEVAQVTVHDPTGDGTPDLAEGQARAVYGLTDVPIGLTSDDIVAQIRPNLAAQADLIANIVAGAYWQQNGALDFTYRRAEDGKRYLYFAGPSDLRPGPDGVTPKPYAYAHRGFFSDPALGDASRVSTTTIAGVADTEHEKLALSEGETVVYVEDDDGLTYRLRFYLPAGDDGELVLEVEAP